MIRALPFVACALLAVACGKEEPRLVVVVRASSFQRLPVAGTTYSMATIPFDVTNAGDATAFVASCGDRMSAAVQQRANQRWQEYSSGICLANLSSGPGELRSGATWHGDVGVGEPGTFRVRIFYSPDQSGSLSMSSASDGFEVR